MGYSNKCFCLVDADDDDNNNNNQVCVLDDFLPRFVETRDNNRGVYTIRIVLVREI